MEQLKRFLRDKGFALALLACLVAAAAAGVWAVRTVRDELKENLDGLNEPDSTSTLPGIDEDLTIIPEEEYPEWQQPTTPPEPGLRRRLLPRLGRRLALVRCANPPPCKAHPRLPAVRQRLLPRSPSLAEC